jgi:hypothetical protein
MELERDYKLASQRRLEDYQQQVKEANDQAAEKAKQRQAEHEEELKQIAAQAADKLREEQKNYAIERKRIYDQFIQRIRDLDAFYLGELDSQRNHHLQMITELDAFLADYRLKWHNMETSLLSGSSTGASGGTTGSQPGSHAFGGYAAYGQYTLGDNPGGGKGPVEYVLSGSTTKAAESLIGGKLSQQAILSAMVGRGPSKSVVWNDHRRFDSRIPLSERRAILEDTKRMLEEMLS